MQITKSREQSLIERRRGWVLKLLDEARPDPLEMAVLSDSLDSLNSAMGRRQLGREVDYLRSLGLVRVFPLGARDELNDVEQATLMQRYVSVDSDHEMGMCLCARITAQGINFQGGLLDIEGVSRVI